MANALVPAKTGDETDLIQRLKRQYDDAREGLSEARIDAEKSRDYYDNDQLSETTRTTLRNRRQPETIRNRIGPAVDGILGVLEQSKVDPRAYPRNPQDEDAADVASKALQYVADQNRFHKVKLDVADNHLVEGAGAAIVEVVGEDIRINRIRFEEFFFDPRSREADYSDAIYMGIGKWMYAGDVQAIYPEFKDDIWGTFSGSGNIIAWDSTWEDKGANTGRLPWVDKRLKRLAVVEMYHREADGWMRSVFCAAGVLESAPSPYKDDYGQPMCPIEASSCFIDRGKGEASPKRYGVVRRMISLQDELNARASRSLHLLNSRQLQVVDANFPPEVGSDVARQEAARPDGVLPTGYQIVPTTDMASGNIQIMQETKGELDRLAPTPAVLGRQGEANQSGRARLVLQQAGMTEIARPLGRFEDWENRIYRQVWLRIKQFWTAEKWIRVTDDEGAPEFIQINKPVYERIPLVDPMTGAPAVDEKGEPMTQVVMQPQPVMDPATGQPQIDPQTGQPVMQPQPVQVGIENRVAQMDMDIVVDTVPDTANLQAEQFDLIAKLAQAYGPEAVPFEEIVRLSSLTGKREFLDRLEARKTEAAQGQAGQMQQAAQIEQARTAAEIEETASKTALNTARAREIDGNLLKQAAEMQVGAIAAGAIG